MNSLPIHAENTLGQKDVKGKTGKEISYFIARRRKEMNEKVFISPL